LSYRVKLLLVLLVALAVLAVVNVGYSALNTLSRLDVIEAQRDQWQHPADVLRVLAVQPGDAIADIGCGSGYFSLKLSALAGKSGHVYAEDIRSLSLAFLSARTILKHARNISVVQGQPADPHLPAERLNEVLIANAYHEFSDPDAILAHVRQALVSGGRLVIIDRAPNSADDAGALSHEISADHVQNDLVKLNFEITARQDALIKRDPDGETWWLIVARKP
jgi:ubiquinone/menaquinone biosynthesis C-methylase UbiE